MTSPPDAPPRVTGETLVERVADAIDAARFAHPKQPRERPRPFIEADRSDREYAVRLAKAAISASALDAAKRALEPFAKLADMIDESNQKWPLSGGRSWGTAATADDLYAARAAHRALCGEGE